VNHPQPSRHNLSQTGSEDRTIQPDLERFLAKRMKAELASSHVPMLSQPRRVYEVIREAAGAVQQSTRYNIRDASENVAHRDIAALELTSV
jgi:hypothetical protein